MIKNVVNPVYCSPLIIAQLIGAAPLYCGSKEACKLIVPIFGMLKNISGNFLNATTIIKSRFNFLISLIKSASLRLVGSNIWVLISLAYFFTADSCSC